MSDEYGDATNAGAGGTDGEAPVADAALAARLETIDQTVSTLGMRVDALVTSTTSYRAALTDRLTEYTDLVTKLTRAQASDLEEYRNANERLLADLRQGLTSSEETLERVGSRIDSLLSDAEDSDDDSRRTLDEVRSILEAQERLGRSLTESLERFAEEVATRLSAAEGAVGAGSTTAAKLDKVEQELASTGQIAAESWSEIAGLRAKVDAILETSANESGKVSTVLDQMKETLLDVASGEVVGALWDELRQMKATLQAMVDESGAGAADQDLRNDIGALVTSVNQLLEQAEVLDEDTEMVIQPPAELLALAEDVAALRDATRETAVDIELPPELAEVGPRLSELSEELQATHRGIEDILGRLDEGLVLADDEARPVLDAGIPVAVADQLAGLRDQLHNEFDAIRDVLAGGGGSGAAAEVDLSEVHSSLGDLLDAVARLLDRPNGTESIDLTGVLASLAQIENDVAALGDRIGEAGGGAGVVEVANARLDPDSLDLLREEIRAAASGGGGGVSEELLGSLRDELKALRRRIKLRAEGEVFSEEDLDAIANAVAERLNR